MIRSMTGYGHSIYQNDECILECEIKGYNNRYLDIVHVLPAAFSQYEHYIDEEIRKVARRGRVEFSLRLKVLKSRARILIDEGLLAEYLNAYRHISAMTGAKASLADYLAIDGVLTSTSSEENYKDALDAVLSEALRAFSETRANDGNGTLLDLKRLGDKFEASLGRIASDASGLEEHFASLLKAKYEELTGEKADSPLFMAELGALLVKYSINEELSRLGVHIAEYRKLISSDEPVGKKLDFLCQEMQRECNTIASKSQLADINMLVVSMKDDIENIREQIRNIE